MGQKTSRLDLKNLAQFKFHRLSLSGMIKSSISLHLFKQTLKFSSAHFLIFDEKRAEMLHGHNYQVELDVLAKIPLESEEKGLGYLVDFGALKKELKRLVDLWDEHVLLPALNNEMKISDFNETTYKVEFRDRIYAFPKKEVVLLPIVNTSTELLSCQLSDKLYPFLSQYPIESYHIRVEETPGQGATYIRYLSK
jgi:6-pyruvoyltetrahydropterin/6-carboxytetrahydropterin synthase